MNSKSMRREKQFWFFFLFKSGELYLSLLLWMLRFGIENPFSMKCTTASKENCLNCRVNISKSKKLQKPFCMPKFNVLHISLNLCRSDARQFELYCSVCFTNWCGQHKQRKRLSEYFISEKRRIFTQRTYDK